MFDEEVPFLQSCLYGYQQETISTMIDLEQPNVLKDDPLYVSIDSDLSGGRFYFQPTIMQFLSSCPQTIQNRGGILCEELG